MFVPHVRGIKGASQAILGAGKGIHAILTFEVTIR